MYDLTCAHRSLPLGTWVKVTDLYTRKWIVVRVNDRGPVPDTRIADLSSEPAYMLGMRARGVTRVRLDVIDPKAAVEIAHLDRFAWPAKLPSNPPSKPATKRSQAGTIARTLSSSMKIFAAM